MEELDFSGLIACYSDRGRTGYTPIMLYAVVTYANMRGVRAVDRIVELCERDLTFVWRGSINYHLAGFLNTIDALYAKYNALLNENGYGAKYDLGNVQMFVIEGMDKVKSVIEKNRKRKLTKHKKLSNNTVIEIDNCSPLEIVRLQKNLLRIADGEGIRFVRGKGKCRSGIQQLY